MSCAAVVVPCYRYGRYLRQCVQSVLAQEGVDVRVLIIDDCSPDETPVVGAALAAADSRVAYRRHEVNCGHIATYNEGIAWAIAASDADYFLLLSADDMLAAGALTRAADVFAAHPEVVLTYGRDIRAAKFDDVSIPSVRPVSYRVMTGGEFWTMSASEGTNVVSTPSAIVRMAAQRAAGGYRPQLPHAGDLEMWLRLALQGSVAVIEAVQACYRTHGGNMSASFASIDDLAQRRDAFASAASGAEGKQPAELSAALAVAYRAIAEDAFWNGSRLFEEGNGIASEQYLEFAVSLSPDLRTWRSWRRFRLKRWAGPAVWGLCRKAIGWARALGGHGAGDAPLRVERASE